MLGAASARWEFASDSIRSPGAVPHLSYGRCLCIPGSGPVESFCGLRPYSAVNINTFPSESSDSDFSDESVCHSSDSPRLPYRKCHKTNRYESSPDIANYTDDFYCASSDSSDPMNNSKPEIHFPLIEEGLYALNISQSDTSETSSSESEHSLELNVDSLSSEEEEEESNEG